MKIFDSQGTELLTLPEAESLGFGDADTLRGLIFRGKLKAVKKGKTWFVKKSDLVAKKQT